jgi:GT2 family glycosyltransferase
MKRLSIVIVSYNVREYLDQCLQSVRKALQGIDSEVIVVDNQSEDDTVAFVREHYPEVCMIESGGNVGFARANNMGIRQSDSEYVLLLNPDTVIAENTLREVMSFMDLHETVGGAGVQMLNADGTKAMESRRGRPTPLVSFYKMCGLADLFPRSRTFARYYMSWLSWNEPAEIEVVSGAFFFIRRKALDEVGLLDEDFFMYGEDIDLSCRLLNAGWHNCYLPCRIIHYKGGSTDKTTVRYVRVFYQAMLIYFRKHYAHLNIFARKGIELAIYIRALLGIIGILPSRLVHTRVKTVITPQELLR